MTGIRIIVSLRLLIAMVKLLSKESKQFTAPSADCVLGCDIAQGVKLTFA